MTGNGLWREIRQGWLTWSEPGAGTLRFEAVDAGMTNGMVFVPALGWLLAKRIASRRLPSPESFVFTTRSVWNVGLLWLAMVTVAELIAPNIAPPIGWLSIRLKNEIDVARVGLERIGIAMLA